MRREPRAQGGGVGADLVEEVAQTGLAGLLFDEGKKLVHRHATSVAWAGGAEISAVGSAGKAVVVMPPPCVPVGRVEVRQMQFGQLALGGVHFAVEKGVVDTELDRAQPGPHEQFARNMA